MIGKLLGLFTGGVGGIIGKGLLYLAVAGIIGGTIYAGYAYVTNLQEENAQLTADKAKLTIATELLEREKRTLLEEQEAAEEAVTELNKELSAARQEAKQSQVIFQEHDFNALLQKKPGLLEPRMQRATDSLLRELEQASND